MNATTVCPTSKHIDLPCIHRQPWSAPFAWLRLGWQDLRRDWSTSLAYGLVFSLLGYGLVHISWSSPHVAMALTSGFLLVAPFLAIGFYELSRRREHALGEGQQSHPFASTRENLASIGLFALLLAFVLSAWERLSAIVVGLHFGSARIPEASVAWLFSIDNLGFVVTFVLLGAVLAAFAFAVSVVSLPMLMDRRVDVVTAIMTSLVTVRENLVAMLVWAGVIVVLAGVGIATNFIGLAVIFPLLGHATWHAYRALVAR